MKLEEIKVDGYERVVYAEEPSSGMRGIISVHNTNLGPACGGVRLLPYVSKEEALEDVLRLSKGMSYKSSLAGIGFGGGKSVIIADPSKKSKALFESFGEFIESFHGRYIAAKDMNITSDDLATIKTKTKHVLGIDGEKGSSGDPSPVTSRGVFHSIVAASEEVLGLDQLDGVKVAIQGIGNVGYGLAELLYAAGAELFVCDTNVAVLKKASDELEAKVVSLETIYDVDCDVFSPCARGAILNAKNIDRLKCKAVVGAANNQLATPEDGYRLYERGILYAPDYAVNSGGIINVFMEYIGYDEEKALSKADEIYDTMKTIFQRSRIEKTPPFIVADKLAEERISCVKK